MNKETDKLIGELCGGLKPVKKLPHPLARMALYFVLTAAYVAMIVWMYGPRHDWGDKVIHLNFLFEIGIATAIWISSMVAAAWLCIPDMRGQNWLNAVPVTLTAVLVFWATLRSSLEGLAFFPIQWGGCFKDGCMMGLVPFVLILIFSRQGATCRPYWMAVQNALSVTMAGWIGLRMTCTMNDMGAGFLHHFIPYMALGIAVGLLARRLFKW